MFVEGFNLRYLTTNDQFFKPIDTLDAIFPIAVYHKTTLSKSFLVSREMKIVSWKQYGLMVTGADSNGLFFILGCVISNSVSIEASMTVVKTSFDQNVTQLGFNPMYIHKILT